LPNLLSLATSCVDTEPRLLPSTGITRLQRYYKPLRHPVAPGPSLTGIRLIVPDHATGLPVLRMCSLCTCCRHYPGTATGGTTLLDPLRRISLPRYGCQVGLCIVLFEVCSTFTRVTACTLALPPICGTHHRRLQPLRYLHDCSGCFRREHFAGRGLHSLELHRLVTAHARSGRPERCRIPYKPQCPVSS